MAKRKKDQLETEIDNLYSLERYSQGIEDQDVEVYTKDCVVLYGVNVSVFRAIASLIDGLSPVRRRILYLMYADQHLVPSGRYLKVPQWLHSVEKYHPHGTLSIDTTFNSMIQSWETNAPLIDVSGNVGSVTGDNAAAIRYLDAKLSLYAHKCFFEEFDKDAVDMIPNYLKTDLEPLWLPARYPNFLVSVTTGIAWGNAMNYAPFNLIEAFELTKALIRNPEMENVYLFPDSPRGYEIIDDGTAAKICETGHGTFKIRASLVPKTDEKGNQYIEVSGFPEGVSMDDTMRAIAVLVQKKEIYGIEDAADKSSLDSVHYVLHLKKGVDPGQVIAQLYANKKTKLTGHCAIEFNFAERTHIIHLGLKDAILEWVERNIDYRQKYYIRKLNEYEKKAHEYAGLLTVMRSNEDFQKAASIIRESDTDEDMIIALMNTFGITSYQASIVADLTLRQNTARRRKELEEKAAAIPTIINKTRILIQSRKNLEDKICEDLDEGIKLFGRPRQCKIIRKSALKVKSLEYRILVTQSNIKKMMTGSNAVGAVQDEVIGYYPKVTDEDILFVINDTGRFYNVSFTKLAVSEAAQKGHSLLDVAGVGGSVVRSILITPKDVKHASKCTVVMFTTSGIIKATALSEFIKCKSELQGIVLEPNDKVCFVAIMEPGSESNKLIYTKHGMGLVVDLKTVSVTARMTKGSSHLSLNNDEICGVCDSVCDNMCIITAKGYVKICGLDDILIAKKKRADMVRLAGISEGDEIFKILPVNNRFDESKIVVHMASGNKFELPGNTIKTTTRISKGFKMIPVKRGDAIVKIRIVE